MPREYIVNHGIDKVWSIGCWEIDGSLIEGRILEVNNLMVAEDIARAFTKAAQNE